MEARRSWGQKGSRHWGVNASQVGYVTCVTWMGAGYEGERKYPISSYVFHLVLHHWLTTSPSRGGHFIITFPSGVLPAPNTTITIPTPFFR
ncbi:hypothetical protein E2C01_027321 [Portunus trituberculatus]|uniref:Uncharacterized protein n=1 Tax=Portunus trituberculatus TaxID=210409 RepID=A0A5B7EHV2_PORTR|nr:hypothetical protein [Portunus trituberculatus]